MTSSAPAGARRAIEEGEGIEGESVTKQIFSTYVCRSSCAGKGVPHPGDIAEAGSLSAVPLPKTDHPLWDALPTELVASGKLSQLQLEGVLYACSKHQQILPSGERAGFMIGDGAGVGKGRQIAGVIIDNWARGRRRHVWLSISTDLHLDAERDLRDLGCYVQVINNCQTLDRESKALGLSKDFKEGVLFMTYSTLIGSARGRSRLQQVIDWLGGEAFDGCIVFDECHKAKNFTPGNESSNAKAATCAIELQARLPMARVLYCSATGVSEVGNMAYMVRMGLFGSGTAFPDFQAFLDSMKKRGVSFLEMLAMEMKAEGKYVARGLSFKDAEFVELEAPLTSQQVALYDASVGLWQSLRARLEEALALTANGSRDIWRLFWSAQQRFFKLLCISMKVPTVVQEAKAALAAGQCVVIGLQTTGEAATDSLGLEPGPCAGFVSTCAEMLSRFVLTHFPVHLVPPEAAPNQQEAALGGMFDSVFGHGAKGTAAPAPGGTPAGGEGRVVEECVQMRDVLLQRVGELPLPSNFLDVLMDQLGGTGKVAEMTGRHGRILRDNAGRTRYELRAKPDSSEMDSLNVKEKETFMKGDKLVAIISDAASTGISLHASRNTANQRRRVHITMELPWSADKAIQQLGRSHRSNQVTGPIYKLVSTRLGGEKRFAAAVARRLQSLGALTRGDRRAASGIDLSEQNFDSPIGRKSLRRMYDHIVQESPSLPAGVTLSEIRKDATGGAGDATAEASLFNSDDRQLASMQVVMLHSQLRQYVDTMGIGLGGGGKDDAGGGGGRGHKDTVTEDKLPKETGKDTGDVRRFLNRILGLPVVQQNMLFNYFAATLASEIRAAKAEGKYSEGLADLFGTKIQLQSSLTLWKDPVFGLKTTANMISIDRGLSFEDAAARLVREAVPGDDSGFRRSLKPLYGRPLVLLALQKPGTRAAFHICRPNTGDSYFDMDRDELDLKYARVAKEEVEDEWRAAYETAMTRCMHGPSCTLGSSCTAGMRMAQVSILSGSVVRVWGVLEAVLHRHETELSKADRTMRVVRVEIGDGAHLVGVRFPPDLLSEAAAELAAVAQQQKQASLVAAVAAAGQPSTSAPLLNLLTKTQRFAGRVEPPTPIDRKSLDKAFTKPKTIKDFFKPSAAAATPTSCPTNAHDVNPAAIKTSKLPAWAKPHPAVKVPVLINLSSPSRDGDLAATAAEQQAASAAAGCAGSGRNGVAAGAGGARAVAISVTASAAVPQGAPDAAACCGRSAEAPDETIKPSSSGRASGAIPATRPASGTAGTGAAAAPAAAAAAPAAAFAAPLVNGRIATCVLSAAASPPAEVAQTGSCSVSHDRPAASTATPSAADAAAGPGPMSGGQQRAALQPGAGGTPAVRGPGLLSGQKRPAAAQATDAPPPTGPLKRLAASPAANSNNLFAVLKQASAGGGTAATAKVGVGGTKGSFSGGGGTTGVLSASGGRGGKAGALESSRGAAKERLVSMGFTSEVAERALWEAGGNEQHAIEICLATSV